MPIPRKRPGKLANSKLPLFDVGILQGEGPRGGVGGSQIPMLQDIKRQKLGKSGSKFRHGVGGIKNVQKKSVVFYELPLSSISFIRTLKSL